MRAVANDVSSLLSSGSTAQLTIAYDPLRIYDVAVSPVRLDNNSATLFYQVSEAMKVSIKIFRPGTSFDSGGNPNPPESVSLVKRIVGVRPARVPIEDLWDATDLRLSKVSDGSYKFKIVASTDVAAIDDLTGDVLNARHCRWTARSTTSRSCATAPIILRTTSRKHVRVPVNGAAAAFQIYVPFRGGSI